MKLKDLIFASRKQLEQAEIEDAGLNSDLLAAHVLGTERSRLPLLWENDCPDKVVDRLNELVARRCQHEPLQYILSDWSFLQFAVKTRPGALIPRPETEEVYMALADELCSAALPPDFSFADICTGSGVLGIALAVNFREARGWLSDISASALAVAEENLNQTELSVRNRLSLLCADLLQAFCADSLDVIVANPPYICSGDMPELMPEVRDFEPWLALDGGADGLDFIRKILAAAPFCLRNGGLLAFEHGHGQRAEILQIIEKNKKFSLLKAGDDICGRERYFILRVTK